MDQAGDPTELRVFLLGHFGIEVAGEPLRLPTRKSELLLAYLLLNPGSHSRERIAARFWGDFPDSSARASLRNALAILRRRLRPDLLDSDRDTVGIRSDHPIWVDVVEFKSGARRFLENGSVDPDQVDVALYTDDLLIDSYDDWVLEEREALHHLYVETLVESTRRMRSHSEYERALEFARLALEADPANETAHQHIMFCHVALGNRDAALRQYESCRRAMREHLGVEPSPETERLYKWIREAPAERVPVAASVTNLPIPVTSFVGRQREITELTGELASERLVTLTGTGGSGKTRLAVRLATEVLDTFRDGVWWVELAAIDDEDSLARSVAKALGVPEVPDQPTTETLANFVRTRNLLLVFDNCEHLVGASASLADSLMSASPELKILATSRERLGAVGERVWRVQGLPVPEYRTRYEVDDLLGFGAVRLFVKRARAFDSLFALTPESASHVVDICARLEGLPLALELAAARVHVLGVEELAARLNDTFDVLGDVKRTGLARHRTLNAAIRWSHDLLADDEQVLFRRLSTFSGGWTLRAAEVTCAGTGVTPDSITDLLARLVDKSLVEVQTRGAGKRYRMLETIRQYSTERLDDSGEASGMRDRHLRYFRDLIEEADPHMGYFLPDAETDLWAERVDADYENLRAGLGWSLEHHRKSVKSVEDGLRLAANLHWFWFARGRFDEGRRWLGRLLEISDHVQPETRARAALTAGYLACWQGDFESGEPLLEEALSLFRQAGDDPGVGFALHGLGFVAMGRGNGPQSAARFEEALKQAELIGDDWLGSFAEHFLAIALTYSEDYPAALSHFEAGNLLLDGLGGHRQGLAFSLFHQGRIARLQGDPSVAVSRHVRSLELFRDADDLRGLGYSLSGLAVLSAAQGEKERAGKLFGAVESIRVVLGSFLEVPLQMEYDHHLSAVRDSLGDEAFENACAEGMAWDLDQAVDHALSSAARD